MSTAAQRLAQPVSDAGVALALSLLVGVGVGAAVAIVGLSAVVLTAAGLCGLSAVGMALFRFEWFVLGFVIVRPALDLSRGAVGAETGTSSIPASALALALLGGGALWLLARGEEGTLRRPAPPAIALGVFALLSVLSGALSLNPAESLPEVARFVSAVMLLVLLDQLLDNRHRARRLLIACAASLVIPLLAAGLQVLTGGGDRLTGSFTHPNSFGIYLALSLVVGTALLPHIARPWRPWTVALLVACAGALLLTYSRGSWLAAVIGLLVVGVLGSRWVLAALVGVAMAAPLLAPSAVARLSDLTQGRSVYGTSGSNSLIWRFDFWDEIIALYTPQVAFTGIGPRMTQFVLGNLPHNDFLRVFVEVGLLGFLAYCAFWVVLLVGSVRRLRAPLTGARRGASVALLAVSLAMCAASLGGNQLSQLVVFGYFLVLVAGTSILADAPDQLVMQPASKVS